MRALKARIRAVFASVRREEEGVAMMVAVVLLGVVTTLAITMWSVGAQSDKASARGRHFVQALTVAESGVERAIARIDETNGTFTGVITGSTAEGNYCASVVKEARNRYRIDAKGGVRASFTASCAIAEARQLNAVRSLRVTLSPPKSFSNALFSYTTAETKNNDVIEGDIWANESVTIAQGTTVTGSITGATGYAVLQNGSTVGGDVRTGGFNPATQRAVYLENNAKIGGSVTASVTAPPDPTTCGGATPANYTVRVDGGASIGGAVKTWGSVSNAGVISGAIQQNLCTSSPATLAMPILTYSRSNYDAATLHEFGQPGAPSATAVQDFQTYVNGQGKRVRGTFYVNQSAPVGQSTRIDLTNVVITGDLTIITNTPIFTNGTEEATGLTDTVVVLASTYDPPAGTSCDVNRDDSECAAHIKNNFAVCNPSSGSPGTAVLIYTPFGPTSIKNNAVQCGAVYGDSIQIKNNQTLKYDPRVERLVGFGPVTLEVTRYLEVAP